MNEFIFYKSKVMMRINNNQTYKLKGLLFIFILYLLTVSEMSIIIIKILFKQHSIKIFSTHLLNLLISPFFIAIYTISAIVNQSHFQLNIIFFEKFANIIKNFLYIMKYCKINRTIVIYMVICVTHCCAIFFWSLQYYAIFKNETITYKIKLSYNQYKFKQYIKSLIFGTKLYFFYQICNVLTLQKKNYLLSKLHYIRLFVILIFCFLVNMCRKHEYEWLKYFAIFFSSLSILINLKISSLEFSEKNYSLQLLDVTEPFIGTILLFYSVNNTV